MTDEKPRPGLAAIRRTRVYEEVADRLREWIASNLRPGDKIPTERELVETFEVSRSSIRDAIHKLQLLGLVETQHGIGTTVAEASPLHSALVAERHRLDELLDFRKILEPPLAARAALHASAEDVEEMEQIVKRQAARAGRGEATIEEDAAFHYSIALAADNSVVLGLLDRLMELLEPARERQFQNRTRIERSLRGHRRILAAIRRQDPAAAEAAMRTHLGEVEAVIDDQRARTAAAGAPSRKPEASR
jgi:GntR family transcriptional repressor for pyruvate dehydrogenase complex